jgi:hypothetical protein
MDPALYEAIIDFFANHIYPDIDRETIQSEWTEQQIIETMTPIFEAHASSISDPAILSLRTPSKSVTASRSSALHNFQRQGGTQEQWKKMSKEEREAYRSTPLPQKTRTITDFAIIQTYLSFLRREGLPIPPFFKGALEWAITNTPERVPLSIRTNPKQALEFVQDFATAIWKPVLLNHPLGKWLKTLTHALPEMRNDKVSLVLQRLVNDYFEQPFTLTPKLTLPSESEIKQKIPELASRIIVSGKSILRNATPTPGTFNTPKDITDDEMEVHDFSSLSINMMRDWLKEHNIKGFSNKTRDELIEMFVDYQQKRRISTSDQFLRTVRFDASKYDLKPLTPSPAPPTWTKGLPPPPDQYAPSARGEEVPPSPPLPTIPVSLTRDQLFAKYHDKVSTLVPTMSKAVMLELINEKGFHES